MSASKLSPRTCARTPRKHMNVKFQGGADVVHESSCAGQQHRCVGRPPWTSNPHLEDQADVPAMRPRVLEAVVQPHTQLLVLWVAIPQLRQQRDLIARCLGVVLCALLDLRVAPISRQQLCCTKTPGRLAAPQPSLRSSALDYPDLEGTVLVRCRVVHQPHRREVAPAQLLQHDVPPILVLFAHSHRVVATYA